MPSFTFEKISSEKIAPPVEPAMLLSSPEVKPRGVIIQILDKLTESRLKRNTDEFNRTKDA